MERFSSWLTSVMGVYSKLMNSEGLVCRVWSVKRHALRCLQISLLSVSWFSDVIQHGREVLTSRRQLPCCKLSFLEERGCSDDLKTKTYIPRALFISRTLRFSYFFLYVKLGSVLVICRLCGCSIRNLRCSKCNLNYFPFLGVNSGNTLFCWRSWSL